MKKLTKSAGANRNGLYFANMGSAYDVPPESQQPTADNTTQADSVVGRNRAGFEKTERATMKQPFDTFYTTNLAKEPPQSARGERINRFEGRSNHFYYYPQNDIKEQKLEAIWFEHANRKLQQKREFEEVKATMN